MFRNKKWLQNKIRELIYCAMSRNCFWSPSMLCAST